MKIRNILVGVLAAIVITNSAYAERYVRYEQNGMVSWGELVDGTIHQLNGAPYLGASRTGTSVSEVDVTLKAPVDPKLSFMTAFNYRDHTLPGYEQDPTKKPGLFTVPVCPNSRKKPRTKVVLPAPNSPYR